MEQVVAVCHADFLLFLKIITAYRAIVRFLLFIFVSFMSNLSYFGSNLGCDKIFGAGIDAKFLDFCPHPKHHAFASHVPDDKD